VGPRAVLDAVVKRKIPSLCRESNRRTPIVQPVAQRYTTELSRLYITVCGRINVLGRISKKLDVRVLTAFLWPRIGSCGGLL
jgi:hypothetical protein